MFITESALDPSMSPSPRALVESASFLSDFGFIAPDRLTFDLKLGPFLTVPELIFSPDGLDPVRSESVPIS